MRKDQIEALTKQIGTFDAPLFIDELNALGVG